MIQFLTTSLIMLFYLCFSFRQESAYHQTQPFLVGELVEVVGWANW